MWVIIFIAGIIVLFMSALLIAYLNLRDTVESMKNTIDFQNEICMTCLEGWKKAIKQLYSDLYNNEEDDNNECE